MITKKQPNNAFPSGRPTMDEELAPLIHELLEAFRDHTGTVLLLKPTIDEIINRIGAIYRGHYLGEKPNDRDRIECSNACIAYLAGAVHGMMHAEEFGPSRDSIPPCPISFFSGQ